MRFFSYIVRRLLVAVAMLFVISVLIFWLFALMPGDYFSSKITITPQRMEELRELYGLNQPIYQRYFTWLGNALHGDFGYSLQYNQPVVEVITPYIKNSFLLAATSFFLTWIIAMFVGVWAATKQYGLFDRITTWILYASLSVPSFFLGMLLIKVFALDLGWFPTSGMVSAGSMATGWARVWEIIQHMVLPVTVLTFIGVGSVARYFRSGMLEVLQADYIRTARAKGLKEKVVIFSHGLRNALLPAITLLAIELPALFSGAIITEEVFSWPGIGRMQLDSVINRDYQVLMTINLLLAGLTILGNLLADILYSAADPRIRLDKKGN